MGKQLGREHLLSLERNYVVVGVLEEALGVALALQAINTLTRLGKGVLAIRVGVRAENLKGIEIVLFDAERSWEFTIHESREHLQASLAVVNDTCREVNQVALLRNATLLAVEVGAIGSLVRNHVAISITRTVAKDLTFVESAFLLVRSTENSRQDLHFLKGCGFNLFFSRFLRVFRRGCCLGFNWLGLTRAALARSRFFHLRALANALLFSFDLSFELSLTNLILNF